MTTTFTCDLTAATKPLPHFWEHTIGSGHATLALRADYQAQLARSRRELGFKYVRFHGILSDDMGTLIVSEDQTLYSFLNADRIMDSLMAIPCYIDFRGIRDAYMREHESDYFENSRRATLVQQAYAIHNPRGFKGYGRHFWGFTASDGPGPAEATIDGRKIKFFNYKARGAPNGPDDGCVAPWAAVASLPFAPEIVLPTIRNFLDLEIGKFTPYGFEATVNPSFPNPNGDERGWISAHNFGINQGPIVLMVENYRTEMIWRLLRECPYVISGLKRAGFSEGWLAKREESKEQL